MRLPLRKLFGAALAGKEVPEMADVKYLTFERRVYTDRLVSEVRWTSTNYTQTIRAAEDIDTMAIRPEIDPDVIDLTLALYMIISNAKVKRYVIRFLGGTLGDAVDIVLWTTSRRAMLRDASDVPPTQNGRWHVYTIRGGLKQEWR